jgi:hypothetical protein
MKKFVNGHEMATLVIPEDKSKCLYLYEALQPYIKYNVESYGHEGRAFCLNTGLLTGLSTRGKGGMPLHNTKGEQVTYTWQKIELTIPVEALSHKGIEAAKEYEKSKNIRK